MNVFVKFRKTVMFAVKFLIVAAVTLGFVSCWTNGYRQTLFSLRGNFVVIFSFVLIFVTFSSLYGAFKIGVFRVHEIIYSFTLAVLFTNVVMYLMLSLIARELVPVWPLAGGLLYQILIVAAASCCANRIYFTVYNARHLLALFGEDASGMELIQKMSRISDRFVIDRGLNVTRTDMREIFNRIDHTEAVVLCDVDKNLQKQILAHCYAKRKRTYLLPDITDILISNAYNIQIEDTPVLMSRNRGLTTEQALVKRFFDIVLSLLAMVIAGPLMLGCAVAIKLDDGGPIFYKQNRITKDGQIFNILKFRSMIVDADKDGAKKAENNDSRITRVGRVIRACRMDELPQLLNILRGDMSLVGPRPERIENVFEYSRAYPQFELRHRVKAGLTGYAQLYGKYNTTPVDKLNMDLMYIENYSLLQDLKLLVLTIKILFMRESTEGFDKKANEHVQASESLHERKEDTHGI